VLNPNSRTIHVSRRINFGDAPDTPTSTIRTRFQLLGGTSTLRSTHNPTTTRGHSFFGFPEPGTRLCRITN
jgi:hypothetical protein